MKIVEPWLNANLIGGIFAGFLFDEGFRNNFVIAYVIGGAIIIGLVICNQVTQKNLNK